MSDCQAFSLSHYRSFSGIVSVRRADEFHASRHVAIDSGRENGSFVASGAIVRI
jgi:hypothetical protein